MELRNKQLRLLEYVKEQHGDQKRKYTGDPYWTHCYNVAAICGKVDRALIEVALCHDLFEDTQCIPNQLYYTMISFGYSKVISDLTRNCVLYLTDTYTHELYPHLNRKERKRLEAERLSKCNYIAQSVKYADIIDNTCSIVENDKGFADVYVQEMGFLLDVMTKGNTVLYNMADDVIAESYKEMISYEIHRNR